tara:strand:- start:45 stop:365 length:321 start_codon:yes stop_codon:yes gene_type:complete
MKLKSLLKETKSWDRKFGEPLPTLEDTTKAYKLKQEDLTEARTIGRKYKNLLKKLVSKEIKSHYRGEYDVDRIMKKMPSEAYDTWEGAWQEIENLVFDYADEIQNK